MPSSLQEQKENDMDNIDNEILKYLCTGIGEGHSNTDKITKHIVEKDPRMEYNRAKIEVVESIKRLIRNGELQIMTIKWEFGEEFLYVCTNKL